MSTHTKGPWETRPGKAGDIKIYMVGARASCGCVATVRVPCGMETTAERNAALIAAAPDLLDAAKRLAVRGFFNPVTCADAATLADMQRMREAILSAAGGVV